MMRSSKVISIFFFPLLLILSIQVPKSNSRCLPSLEELHRNRRLTRVLHHHIKMWQISPHFSNSIPETPSKLRTGPQALSFNLLESVAQIAKAACPNRFVSHEYFLDTSMKAFQILRSEIFGKTKEPNARIKDLVTSSLFQRIQPILISCQKQIYSEEFKFRLAPSQRQCSDGLISQICYKSDEMYLCKELKLRNVSNPLSGCSGGDTNLILDVVWSMVDLVHGLCFEHFRSEDDLTAFTMWEQAMESLFNNQIMDYWYKSDLSTEMYQLILHPLAIQQLYNLEMCVEGMYYLSNRFKIPRLQRPARSKRMYRKRRHV